MTVADDPARSVAAKPDLRCRTSVRFHQTAAAAAGRTFEAQRHWNTVSVRRRLRVITGFRRRISSAPQRLAKLCGRDEIAESLAAEVLPLADACRFLERNAVRILKPRRPGRRGRPLWLSGVSSEVRREPFGIVLVIGPSNYPLMIPGIQILQALTAGNAVFVKPAVGATGPVEELKCLLVDSGLDAELLHILPEDVSSVEAALDGGIQKVVLTGSADSGRRIQQMLAERLIPSSLELSGCDAVFVTETAELDRVTKCLVMGLLLNGGRTCIAPRRVFVHQARATSLKERVQQALRDEPQVPICREATPASRQAADMIREAVRQGATVLTGQVNASTDSIAILGPLVLSNVTPEMQVTQTDVFAPVMSILEVDNMHTARLASEQCVYGLGASIFGSDADEIESLKSDLSVGCITVNDLIVPTADPRLPFGGRRQSGFGVTRGTEGLQEMTQLKSVVTRHGNWLPHLDESTPFDADLLSRLVTVSHGTPLQRIRAAFGLLRATMATMRHRRRDHSTS